MSLRADLTRVLAEARDRAIAAGTIAVAADAALPPIGLAPTGALLEVAADVLGLQGFTADQALELRLARDR